LKKAKGLVLAILGLWHDGYTEIVMSRGKETKRLNAQRAQPREAGKTAGMIAAAACVLLGTALCALSAQSILQSSVSAESLMSFGLWKSVLAALGGGLVGTPAQEPEGEVGFAVVFGVMALIAAIGWLGGTLWIMSRRGQGFWVSALKWGGYGGMWWILGGSWELARLAAFLIGARGLEGVVLTGPAFWIAIGLAGGLATLMVLGRRSGDTLSNWRQTADPISNVGQWRDDFRIPWMVWACWGLYVVVFVAMNWGLYRNLLLPHGDSAMYEEHLWNLLHGKGFRSYLDQGLFLGEHVQVIHLLLLPFYLLWPSQMMMELCGSAILASGCIPVYWIARRHTGDKRAALWLAAAYLLYFPTQFLDIAIDLKTFRPNGLGIPILLFALDQLERRRYKTLCVLLLITLSAQEDYAIMLAPLGIWIALRQAHVRFASRLNLRDEIASSPSRGKLLVFGLGLTLFSVLYLFVSTRLIMGWFRNWQEIHYAGYFTKFGKTLPEIAKRIVTDPALFWREFGSANTAMYALGLLVPIGFLSFFSPARLAVAFPLFVTLGLNEVIREPRHHVHAAMIPFIFWSAAAGLATVSTVWQQVRSRSLADLSVVADRALYQHAQSCESMSGRRQPAGDSSGGSRPPLMDFDRRIAHGDFGRAWSARFAFLCALVTGIFFGLSPLSLAFWESDSPYYWGRLYVPGKRAEMFARVLASIPKDARVASTDFVHPRFTHFARSYDYSDYPRAVSNYENRVPDDTDYIVIDTQHPYSRIKRPDQVRELRAQPDQWQLLPDTTDGYFIVLKRIRPAARAYSPHSSK
jgi:uncharacterized membrane protein